MINIQNFIEKMKFLATLPIYQDATFNIPLNKLTFKTILTDSELVSFIESNNLIVPKIVAKAEEKMDID
jgi:hypothetical protein